jgi:hypothetical protein
MPQVCSKCSRVNPAEAAYCYWDGAVLEGHSANGGPIASGSQPFPNQFVFPSGQACRNFDQLAMTCQQNWKEAVDLLKQGYLASFLGGLGRADLARAAQEAARFPDQDRGLDQLLAKLPSHVLEPPRLRAEPSEVNLGLLRVGTDRKLDLHLVNQGMRLLYGSVTSDARWLRFGEGPGNAQKVFQFGSDALLAVHVRGKHLRAGNKPLEGRLLIDSNGGTTTVTVRADVPIKPFPTGVLAGALTPRQIAEKAKAQPKEAAALFENGAVAQWFGDNGWTYPVQGPSASGIGAVQQFFEALGLANAPKLEISHKSLSFHGEVGQTLTATLEVRTAEKRPVYAHARADEPWLDVSKTTLSGRVATITVRIPGVPNRPGQTLSAMIRVTGNGNQRFKVPVTLTVGENAYFAPVTPVGPPLLQPTASPFAFAEAVPVVAAVPVSGNEPIPVLAVTAEPLAVPLAEAAEPAPLVTPRRARRAGEPGPWKHLIPLGVLLLLLLGVVVKDTFFTRGGGTAGDDGTGLDPRPRIAVFFADGNLDPRFQKGDNSMRFGVVMLDPSHPQAPATKQLTYSSRGLTNTTVVRIDNTDNVFGFHRGRWEVQGENLGPWGGKRSVWLFDDGVRVTQLVEVIPGEPVEVSPGTYRRLLDTALVRYTLENKDTRAHRLGIRVMIDTLIGSNDGVPFTVPGMPGLVSTFHDFPSPEAVPDFIQALEIPDLKNPGTVAQMNFKVGGRLEPPTRVSLTHWPGISPFWEVPIAAIRDDSAVVMYWKEREVKPGEKREVGFSYGLGDIAAKSGALGVTVGGSFTPGGELTVVGLVSRPQPNEKLTLTLPQGFTLVSGEATQPVPPSTGGRPSPVTWRVRSSGPGRFDLRVHSSAGADQTRRIAIKTNTIF